MMKLDITERGFGIIRFKDRYNSPCSIQESSLATEEAIWFGIDDADPCIMAKDVYAGGRGWIAYEIPSNVSLTTRMHLTQNQVRELLPILIAFVETGTIDNQEISSKDEV